jgi:hypothetical protein
MKATGKPCVVVDSSGKEICSKCGDEALAEDDEDDDMKNVIQGLSWIDRLLALWIILAMILGVLLGKFVPAVGVTRIPQILDCDMHALLARM